MVGGVIGVGIFLTPAGMAKSLGSPLLLVVWLTMGVMALCGALCYGELAARYPEAGGGYVYLREALDQRSLSCTAGWRFGDGSGTDGCAVACDLRRALSIFAGN